LNPPRIRVVVNLGRAGLVQCVGFTWDGILAWDKASAGVWVGGNATFWMGWLWWSGLQVMLGVGLTRTSKLGRSTQRIGWDPMLRVGYFHPMLGIRFLDGIGNWVAPNPPIAPTYWQSWYGRAGAIYPPPRCTGSQEVQDKAKQSAQKPLDLPQTKSNNGVGTYLFNKVRTAIWNLCYEYLLKRNYNTYDTIDS
jgi:hypothetical protein